MVWHLSSCDSLRDTSDTSLVYNQMYNIQTPTYTSRKRVIAETDISGIAAQIRAIRKRKGVSQAELAQ